jgi:hypothetical protein
VLSVNAEKLRHCPVGRAPKGASFFSSAFLICKGNGSPSKEV